MTKKRKFGLIILLLSILLGLGVSTAISKYMKTENVGKFNLTISSKKIYAIYNADEYSLNFYYGYAPEDAPANCTVYNNVGTASYTPEWTGVASSIKSVTIVDTISPVSTRKWFSGFTNIKSADLNLTNLNTANVIDASYMFEGCGGLTSLDLSSFATSNVTNMSYMFSECRKLTSLNIDSFNTSAVTNMRGMFFACNALIALNVRHFDTASVTNMREMFAGCRKLTELDVSSFNTERVTTMRNMFSACEKLLTLDLSNFKTPNITSVSYMFSGDSALQTLKMGNFSSEKLSDISYAFNECNVLTSLDLSSFNTVNVENMNYTFHSCYALQTIYVSQSFVTGVVGDNSTNMFLNCNALVGGNGTAYNESYINKTYARIDKEGQAGYFTEKSVG